MRFEFPILFAARLFQIRRVVLGAHNDFLLASVAQRGGYLYRKRSVATFMLKYFYSVDPNRRGIIDRTKMEHEPLARFHHRPVEVASIPYRAIEARISDTAAQSFGGKGYQDNRVPDHLFWAAQCRPCIDREVPRPIETNARLAPQLRAKMI